MLKYIIRLSLFLGVVSLTAQNKPIDTKPKDTVIYKQSYGLRVGLDLSRIIRSSLDDDYTGLEIVADYRLTQDLYLAAELGNEDITQQEDLYSFNTTGSYLKVGVDRNTYANWYGEQNLIFYGGRIGFSTFNNTLNNYQIFDNNRYWNPDGFATVSEDVEEFNGRTASWIEAVLGTKFEILPNIYLGASVRLAFLFTDANEGRFPILYVPGFNKVTWDSKFGVGYNYSISYFIPLYKKKKKVKKITEEEQAE